MDCKTADRVVDSLAALRLCRRTTLTLRKDAPLAANPAAAAAAVEERCDMALLPHLEPDDPHVHAVAVRRYTTQGVGAASRVPPPPPAGPLSRPARASQERGGRRGAAEPMPCV